MSVCEVFTCVQTVVWQPVFGIVNVPPDVDAEREGETETETGRHRHIDT